MFFKHTKWAMLWALLILFLCGIPGSDIPHISLLEEINFDKFVHAFLFFVLISLAVRGFILQTVFFKLQQYPKSIAFIICIIYGGSLEIMQGTLIEQRTASAFDFIADSIGTALGLLFYNQIEKYFLIRLMKQ